MAWPKVGDGALPLGEAQRLHGKAWGGANRSEHVEALGGSDGSVNGAQRLQVVQRHTGMSGRFLGRWWSRTRAVKAGRSLCERVEHGTLARSRHGRRETRREHS